ncbi:MAG: hypothetical protein LT103_10960 [Burkholderiaceae bacterium]|nr:hypothetical protein [Burkholderiaceae bacterium]
MALTVIAALYLFPPLAIADDKIDALLATLSTAKAQTEGRAVRLQGCTALKGRPALADLRSRYDTARSHFNARLDAWLYSLKYRKSFDLARDEELAKLNGAIEKINDFVQRSDTALTRAPCALKVFWKEAALAIIAITPALIDSLKSFWVSSETTDKEKESLLVALEQYRIAEWTARQIAVAFNFRSDTFIRYSELNDEALRQAPTAVYVNKWALREQPGATIVPTKLPPDQLSQDYILYTGKLSDVQSVVIPNR